MTALAVQQQGLLAALWGESGSANATKSIAVQQDLTRTIGLKAYQNHASMLAQRVLQAAYPATARLMGSERFAAMARAFWQAEPPASGDLAQWGGDLHDFLARSEALAGQPWWPDLAHAEWALHAMATAADVDQERSTLALLLAQEPARLQMRLAPGTALLVSPWPLDRLLEDGLNVGLLPEPAATASQWLVWRQGYQPRIRACAAGEAAFVAALLADNSLGQALDRAPALDFQAWLAQAVPDALWISNHLR